MIDDRLLPTKTCSPRMSHAVGNSTNNCYTQLSALYYKHIIIIMTTDKVMPKPHSTAINYDSRGIICTHVYLLQQMSFPSIVKATGKDVRYFF